LAVHHVATNEKSDGDEADASPASNLYAYVSGAVLKFIDELGLQEGPRAAPAPWTPPEIIEPEPEKPILRFRLPIVEPAGMVGFSYTRAIRSQLPTLTLARLPGSPKSPSFGYIVGPYSQVRAAPEVLSEPKRTNGSGRQVSNVEAHHGLLSAFARNSVPYYNAEAAPTISMTHAEHNITRANGNTLVALMNWNDARMNYTSGTTLATLMSSARGRAQVVDFILRGTDVTAEARDEYLRQFETYRANQVVESQLRSYESQYQQWTQSRAVIKAPDPVEPP